MKKNLTFSGRYVKNLTLKISENICYKALIKILFNYTYGPTVLFIFVQEIS